MMNDDMLRNIEYLREKADVSYEDAASMLERFDGNVMRVLVELERQGRVYPQGPAYEQAAGYSANTQQTQQTQHTQQAPKGSNAKKQASSFVSQALKHRIVVESGTGEEKKTIANLSAPYCVGATIVAPWLAIGSVGLMFALGYRVKVQREKVGPMPEDVETFVDKTVSNIKKAASSFTETVRSEKQQYEAQKKRDGQANTDNATNSDNGNTNDNDDNDEGGEITIE